MRPLALLLLLLAASLPLPAQNERILIYTRNYTPDGKGYVHDNIATSVDTLKRLASSIGFAADHSEDPAGFTDANLNRYRALVFSSSNNEAFNTNAQREALQRYIRSGGGFVGIHSATGSERNWPWYASMLGGKFLRHPKLQTFTVRVKDPSHPATRGLPATFSWEDECYYHKPLYASIRPLLVTDPAQLDDPNKAEYPGTMFGDSLPLAWSQEFEGGRTIHVALGHKKEHYSDPLFLGILRGAILWAARQD